MNNDDAFMSKLIEETCTEAVEKDQPESSFDLRNYFEKRLNQVDHLSIKDYLEQHFLKCNSLTFLSTTMCYRLIINNYILDFPSNWSIFAEIGRNDLILLDNSEDSDYLLDVFSEISGHNSNIALFKDNEEIHLVLVPGLNSIEHFTWIKSYFEKKKSSIRERKAA